MGRNKAKAHELALEFLEKSEHQGAVCDKCNAGITKGEGYLCKPAVIGFSVGESIIDVSNSPDLLCENCFDQSFTAEPFEAKATALQSQQLPIKQYRPMDWKLMFYLSSFGLLQGISDLFSFSAGINIALVLIVLIGVAILIAIKAPEKHFKYGFIIGVLGQTLRSLVVFIFFPIFATYNPEIIKGFKETQSSLEIRFVLLLTNLVGCVTTGLMIGFFSWLAGKIIKKKATKNFSTSI